MPTDPKSKKKTSGKKSVAKPTMSSQPAVAKSKAAKAATAGSGPSNPSGSGN